MEIPTFHRYYAIRNTHPSVVALNGTPEDGDEVALDENNNPVTLDESKIAPEMTRLQTEYDNKKYQRDRALDYPSIQDQLDDLYHNGIDGWKATIKITKDKYPKE
tara:strand:- start:34 stop:348 length:315 start_codon:yes stop_codon:yes gene_type:complete